MGKSFLSACLKLHELTEKLQSVISKLGIDLLVLVLYLILTLVLLSPFSVLKMNKQLIGMNPGDTYQGVWNLWWIRKSVLSFENPYMTDFIFYPNGADLFVHSLSPIAGLFSIDCNTNFVDCF